MYKDSRLVHDDAENHGDASEFVCVDMDTCTPLERVVYADDEKGTYGTVKTDDKGNPRYLGKGKFEIEDKKGNIKLVHQNREELLRLIIVDKQKNDGEDESEEA